MTPDDPDDLIPYRRPSVSAWVAVAAVAFAVFTLGGFIKTYLQLEQLRDDSRREIGELRAQLDTLRLANRIAAVPSARAVASARTLPEPTLRPAERRLRPAGRAGSAPLRTPTDPARVMAEAEDLCLTDGENGKGNRVTYTFGRSSAAPAETLALGDDFESPVPAFRGEVVAVNNSQKRLMAEGGRDVGLELGARLELSRQGRWIGDLRVLEVFDSMSACEVLHSTQTPEPGDTVRMP